MAVTPQSPDQASDSDRAIAPRPSLADTLAVYLKRRVLIVMLLGFSSGLPLALSGSTLAIWMTEVGVNLKTIGLFALVGTPYTIKFLWAPLTDALNVPLLSRWFGRRRGWLLLSQFLLIAAVVFVGVSDPGVSPLTVALGVLLVATISATQDIVVDAFRVESLDESEQAAGMAAYVAGYRIGALASTAGALFLVSAFQDLGLDHHAAWRAGYFAMAALVLVGVVTALAATEPPQSAKAEATLERENMPRRLYDAAVGAFTEFLSRDLAFVVLIFVVLFKLTDALSGVMTAPFVIDLGFSRNEYAAIIKGVGFAATLIGGFAGGFLARAFSLPASLLIGAVVQGLANLGFSWQAVLGHNIAWLTFAIVLENFTSAVATVVFVAYLSALCRNPLHTATQYALLTALAAVGRTYLSSGAGYIVSGFGGFPGVGWAWFFAICAVAGVPALILLGFLQHRGHFVGLLPAEK
jgi:MFS transporter, PAT family, beta-lactamase induction signal transducer AmpG